MTASIDRGMVDMLAVEFACNGTVMPLNRDSATVAAERMCGRVPTAEIARRCRIPERQVLRLLAARGAQRCPVCLQMVMGAHLRFLPFLGGVGEPCEGGAA